METLIDNYINKIAEIKNVCENVNTNKLQLEALLNDLQTIDNNLNNQIGIETTTPTSFILFKKYISVEIERSRKDNLHKALYNLIKIRSFNVDNVEGIENKINYSTETKSIEQYIKNVVSSCNCMTNREFIVNMIR